MSADINQTLIDIAVYSAVGGVAIILFKNRFPDQWNIIFPNKQTVYQSKTFALQAENRKLEQLKSTLQKYQAEKTKMLNLTKETNGLAKEIESMEKPKPIPQKISSNTINSISKEVDEFFNKKPLKNALPKPEKESIITTIRRNFGI